MKQGVLTLLLGLWLGVVLDRSGFSSWDEVHRMFTFRDPRMLLVFFAAVTLLSIAWKLIARLRPARTHFRARPIHPGSLAGGLLFGVGWALTGACPSVACVQLGEGQLAALWTLGGMFVGNWLYAAVHARFFRWDAGSCGE